MQRNDEDNNKSVDVESVPSESNRRSEAERRAPAERRRSARGLFELRARRDKIVEDRRQTERRTVSRFRWLFWRGTGT